MQHKIRIALAVTLLALAALSAVDSAWAGIDVSWVIWEWRKFGP
jgi:hypothetical protein